MQHPHRVQVRAAATALQWRRDVVASVYAHSEGDDGGSVVAVGGGEEFTGWLFARSPTWRTLHSIRIAGPDEDPGILVRSLRNNRRIVDDGLAMRSVFADSGFGPDVLDLLAGQEIPYLVAEAPLNLKIVDGRSVVLEGPEVDGARSLMLVHDPTTMALAARYWRAVSRTSRSAAEAAEARGSALSELTPRQRAVAALMARDSSDEHAAEVLGVSVRTLRSDISGLKRALGVTTRFAAGLEIGRRTARETGLHNPADPSDVRG